MTKPVVYTFCFTLLLVDPSISLTAQEVQAQSVDFEAQLAEYVQVQEALAADDFATAKLELQEFTEIAESSLQAQAIEALAAENIEDFRARFKPLSALLAEQTLPVGFARAYCPMYDSGSAWVQRDGPVRNPYYGAFMLTCGVVDAAAGAHIDLSPRYGGTVFMAPDSFHHIEGTYPEPGIFRIYASDNYREPVNVSGWTGRAVTEEVYDEATDEFLEVAAYDLVSSPDGAFLEALIPNSDIPAEVTAKVIFDEDFPFERFAFIFGELSVEASPTSTTSADYEDAPEAIPLAARILPDLPEDPRDIASQIASRGVQISEMISRGAFTEIFIPALQAKELALALDQASEGLPLSARNEIRIAVRHLVRAAYLLDWYGDLGNRNDVDSAYGIFETAVISIDSVYALSDRR